MIKPEIDLDVLQRATILRFTDETGADTGDETGWDGDSGLDSSSVLEAELNVSDPEGNNSFSEDITDYITDANPITGDVVFGNNTGEWIDGYYDVEYLIRTLAQDNFISAEDYSATVAGATKFTADGNHNLETGMWVVPSGSVYTEGFEIKKIDATTFYGIVQFVSDDSGTFYSYYRNTYTPFVFANAEMAIDKMFANYAVMRDMAESERYLDDCLKAYGYLKALYSGLSISNTATVNELYERITRILDFYQIELING